MYLAPFGPGDELKSWSRRVQDIMDEMRNRSFCDFRRSGTWMPNINIYESKLAYYLCVELAGLSRETVTVECPDPQHVTIAGQRTRPRLVDMETPVSVELMEIDEGLFHRKIDFAEEVHVDVIELLYDEGYLWVTLRKVGAR